MVSGAFFFKILEKYLGYHQIQSFTLLLMLLLGFLFNLSINSTFWQAVFMLLLSSCGMVLDIVVNICILLITPNKDTEFWMLITHGIFGLGGLLGPLVVYIFEENSMLYGVILMSFGIPIYLRVESPISPENKKQGQEDNLLNKSIIERRSE